MSWAPAQCSHLARKQGAIPDLWARHAFLASEAMGSSFGMLQSSHSSISSGDFWHVVHVIRADSSKGRNALR